MIMNNKVSSDSTKLAGRTYDTGDYQKKDNLSSGLATTHEQVSDTYMEGEMGAVIDDVKGKDIPLNSKVNTKK
jgi:hypothetical protein